MKLLVAGIVLYFGPSWRWFRALHNKWWPDQQTAEQIESRTKIMRSRFWKSFGLVAAVVVTTVLLLLYTQTLKELTPRYSVRAIAATIMLTATLARGGWDIQSWKGKTTNERIDRAMFILSQVGATGILLLALAL